MRTFGLSKRTLAFLFASLAMPFALSAQDTPPASSVPHSEMMPLAATRALILAVEDASSRVVAVGERGQVLVSENRTDWRQIPDVPTRATLTALSTVGDAVWAVGHDGIIIHSQDGGLTWVLQRRDVFDSSDDADFDPHQGVPLLDVLMLSKTHGFAVGAYSQLLRTDDGGSSWRFVPTDAELVTDDDTALSDAEVADEGDVGDEDSWTFSAEDLEMDLESEPHFNAITHTGSGALMIVGERGAGFRSRDDGVNWERIQLPYQGSMFGLIGYEGDHIVAFGMRGNIYETYDLGDTWNAVDTDTDLSLMGGSAYGNGGFVLVGSNGIVIIRDSANATPVKRVFTNDRDETPVLADVAVRQNRSLVLSGDKGVDNFTPAKK